MVRWMVIFHQLHAHMDRRVEEWETNVQIQALAVIYSPFHYLSCPCMP